MVTDAAEAIALVAATPAPIEAKHDGLDTWQWIVLDALPMHESRNLADLQTITGLTVKSLVSTLDTLIGREDARQNGDKYQRVQN